MDLSKLTETELKEALLLKEKLDNFSQQEKCRESFLEYINHMWPEFICGKHHKIFAEKLEKVVLFVEKVGFNYETGERAGLPEVSIGA